MSEFNTSDSTDKSVAYLAINELRSAGSFPNRMRIIARHIHEFQPPELSPSLSYCDAVSNPGSAFVLESLQNIFLEIIRNRSRHWESIILPAAVKSSLHKTGQTLTDWCIFELKAFRHVVHEDECVVAARRLNDAASCAIAFLCALLNSSPEFFVENPGLDQKVDETIIITWLKASGLRKEDTSTFLYALQATRIIGPARTVAALENAPADVEVLSSLLKYVERFANHGVEKLEMDGTEHPLQVQEAIWMLSMISLTNKGMLRLLTLLGGVTWMCYALSKIMKDSERYGWVHPSVGDICSYLCESFRQDITHGLVEIAFRHRLLSSLSRCVSATDWVVPLHHIPEVERLLDYLASVVETHPPILRLACRAVDAGSIRASDVSAWKELDDTIRIHRQRWSVDPVARPGRRCMSPKCARPYGRRLFRCSGCQLPSLVVCSRNCQKYLWNELGHKQLCKSIILKLSDDPVDLDEFYEPQTQSFIV